MTATERYDAIVIGTGQGGKPLAARLADAGHGTAIIERGRVGGTCVVAGCTPTKTMIASARVAHLARRAGDYGVRTGPVSVDLLTVRRRKRQIVDQWSAGNRRGLERHQNLDLVMGEARFAGPREIVVDSDEHGTRRLAAEKVFINAGARPTVPPIPGLADVDFLDSTSIMELDRVPDHLIVLGGGFIGLEFGQMFRRFGAAVTMLEMAPRLIPREDEDVSQAVAEILREDGIDVRTGSKVERVARARDDGVEVVARGPDGEYAVEGSHLLVAVGRTPNTDALELDAAGVETDDRGYIAVDGRLETNVPGIYALGDITGAPPFTHVAYDDFRVLRTNLLEGGDATTDGRLLPYTVFIDPQLGRVGLTEREARDEGIRVRVAKLPMSRIARAIETDETRGFMKAVVDADTDGIVGAAVLGVDGGEVVSVLQVAMMGDLPYTALEHGVFAHPTLAESLNNLFMAMDR
ncbi:MAG: mercuric reductase [Gemmatimonadota bacterium]